MYMPLRVPRRALRSVRSPDTLPSCQTGLNIAGAVLVNDTIGRWLARGIESKKASGILYIRWFVMMFQLETVSFAD